MSKRLDEKGFALAETLVCALFVAAIFLIIFENYLPLMAKYNRTEKYDDLDSKYIAFYIRTFIETDTKTVIENVNGKLEAGKLMYTFKPLAPTETDADITEIADDTAGPFELCTLLSKENKQKCQSFVDESNITKIFLIPYETTDLKDNIKNPGDPNMPEELKNISVPLQLYIENMPSYKATAASKTGYKRIIVEIKHEDKSTDDSNEVYYSYATIELRPAK